MQGLLRPGESPDTHRPLPQALLNDPFVNPTRMPNPKQGSLRKKRPLEPRMPISLQPPVYGILEGFGANSQYLILINQLRECILRAVAAGQMQLGFCEAWRARISLLQGHKLTIYVCSSIHGAELESAKPEVLSDGSMLQLNGQNLEYGQQKA